MQCDHALEGNRREEQHAFQQERIPGRPVRQNRRVPSVRHGIRQIDGTVHRKLDRKQVRPRENHIIHGTDGEEEAQQSRFGNRRAEVRKENDPRLGCLEQDQQEEQGEHGNRRGQIFQDGTPGKHLQRPDVGRNGEGRRFGIPVIQLFPFAKVVRGNRFSELFSVAENPHGLPGCSHDDDPAVAFLDHLPGIESDGFRDRDGVMVEGQAVLQIIGAGQTGRRNGNGTDQDACRQKGSGKKSGGRCRRRLGKAEGDFRFRDGQRKQRRRGDQQESERIGPASGKVDEPACGKNGDGSQQQ